MTLLFSENVSEELKQTSASQQDKQQMLEILRRFHESQEPLSGAFFGGVAESHQDDSDEGEEGEQSLSEATISKILTQVCHRKVWSYSLCTAYEDVLKSICITHFGSFYRHFDLQDG